MLCCIDCFNDKRIINHLNKNGHPGYCDYCHKNNPFCIPVENLCYFFKPVVELYFSAENAFAVKVNHENGDTVGELIQHDWDTFNHDLNICSKLVDDIFAHESTQNGYDYPTGAVFRKIEFDQVSREKIYDWEDFSKLLINSNRYVYPSNLYENVTKALNSACKHYGAYIQKDTVFFRARAREGSKPYSTDEMTAPPKELTKPGRANPRGIPYLYLASNENTAIHEIKAPNGSYVNVGEFIPSKRLRVLDLCDINSKSPFFERNIAERVEGLDLIKILAKKLSIPVKPWVDDIEYIPTQFLSEFIKHHFNGSEKFHGIKYKSQYDPDGYNLVLFDVGYAKCNDRIEIYEIKETKQKYELL